MAIKRQNPKGIALRLCQVEVLTFKRMARLGANIESRWSYRGDIGKGLKLAI